MQTVAVFCVLQEIRLCFLFGIGVSPGATAMKDASNKSPSEEQSPPAAPSVIRDERRWERREQKNGGGGRRPREEEPSSLLQNYTRGEENLPAFD